MESNYTKTILDEFCVTFPDLWIEQMDWSKSHRLAFAKGIKTINDFREYVVLQLSKLVLSGDHLVNETHALGELQLKINECVDDVLPRKVLKVKLRVEYQSMLKDVIDIVHLVKNHIEQTKDKFLSKNIVVSASFISFKNRSDRHKMVSLMRLICDSCEIEYSFSYDELYISHLLSLRLNLLKEKQEQKQNEKLQAIVHAVLTKVELLLGKMSAFSDNKKIQYYCDWQLETIELDKPDKYSKEDFRFLFQKYLDPTGLDDETIDEWQKDSMKNDVAMWKLAFLMRYYTKCTKSIIQIDNLIGIANRHHGEYVNEGTGNCVNDYAASSFLNYMYNSRFSFLCQCDKGYTYEQMKKDLAKIEAIQAQTLIKNYHPYQNAVEFTIKVIESKLAQMEFEDITSFVSDLQDYFEKYKRNVNWCKTHQPYLVQLRYNFSSITIEGCDFKTFCPSSFCRPLRFKELEEKAIAYANKIAFLQNELYNQHNRRLFMEAKLKIDSMERKNMEQMGLFITITTFLVGLLSIFIGNSGSVPLVEKLQYVAVLGCILIIFVCIGCYVVQKKHSKFENGLFGGTVCLLGLTVLGFSTGKSNSVDAFHKTNVQQETSSCPDTTNNAKQFVLRSH